MRDPIPNIFYPGHWGFFGGAIDPHETPENALIRELEEELALKAKIMDLTYFTSFTFDFSFAKKGVIARHFYTLRLERWDNLTLHEGAEMGAFTAREALGTLPLVSYDSFAIWMHAFQNRLTLP